MMYKISSIVLSWLFFMTTVCGQQLNVEFGGQVSLPSTFVKISDTGNKAEYPILNSSAPSLGLYAKVNIPKWGGLKVGVLQHNWSRTVCMEGMGCASSRSNSSDIEIELLYHKEIMFKRSRWSITPYLGYGLGIRPTAPSIWVSYEGAGTNPPRGAVPYIEGEYNNQLQNYYHLINLELEGSYQLSDHFRLSAYFKYGQGLTTITEDRFTYWYEDGSTGDASFTQNGGYWSLGLRLSYLFTYYKNRA